MIHGSRDTRSIVVPGCGIAGTILTGFIISVQV